MTPTPLSLVGCVVVPACKQRGSQDILLPGMITELHISAFPGYCAVWCAWKLCLVPLFRYVCIFAHVCGDQRLMPGVFFSVSPLHSFLLLLRQSLSLKQELGDLASLAGQQAPEIALFLHLNIGIRGLSSSSREAELA